MKPRGQMGFIGEDLIALTVIILALSGLFVFNNALFSLHVARSEALDSFHLAWVLADNLAYTWSYQGRARILDPASACTNCPVLQGYNLSYTVWDLGANKRICECGYPTQGKIARLPVAIRYNYIDVRPGILEVVVARKQA